MQACIYDQYGSADVVRLGEVAKPVAKAGELLIRVRATSVTTADWRFRASEFPRVFWLPGRLMTGLFRPRNPVLGMDFSGVVEAIGSPTSRFQLGDRVFGATNATSRGAHAEYVVVSEAGAITHKPDSLSDAEAATIPFGANSALALLRDIAKVQPGQRVLIVGASGSVGTWAVQLAHHFGAVVTGVCSARNAQLVRSLGAQHVIDYASEKFAQAGDDYDLIFDTAGVTHYAGCKSALAERGIYLPLTSGATEIAQALLSSLGSGKKLKFAISENTRDSLEFIVGLIEAGALRPLVDRVYPMEEIAAAHRHVEGRHKRGSVVVAIPASAGA